MYGEALALYLLQRSKPKGSPYIRFLQNIFFRNRYTIFLKILMRCSVGYSSANLVGEIFPQFDSELFRQNFHSQIFKK